MCSAPGVFIWYGMNLGLVRGALSIGVGGSPGGGGGGPLVAPLVAGVLVGPLCAAACVLHFIAYAPLGSLLVFCVHPHTSHVGGPVVGAGVGAGAGLGAGAGAGVGLGAGAGAGAGLVVGFGVDLGVGAGAGLGCGRCPGTLRRVGLIPSTSIQSAHCHISRRRSAGFSRASLLHCVVSLEPSGGPPFHMQFSTLSRRVSSLMALNIMSARLLWSGSWHSNIASFMRFHLFM